MNIEKIIVYSTDGKTWYVSSKYDYFEGKPLIYQAILIEVKEIIKP